MTLSHQEDYLHSASPTQKTEKKYILDVSLIFIQSNYSDFTIWCLKEQSLDYPISSKPINQKGIHLQVLNTKGIPVSEC